MQGGIDDVLRCVQYPVVPGAMKGKNVVVCGVWWVVCGFSCVQSVMVCDVVVW